MTTYTLSALQAMHRQPNLLHAAKLAGVVTCLNDSNAYIIAAILATQSGTPTVVVAPPVQPTVETPKPTVQQPPVVQPQVPTVQPVVQPTVDNKTLSSHLGSAIANLSRVITRLDDAGYNVSHHKLYAQLHDIRATLTTDRAAADKATATPIVIVPCPADTGSSDAAGNAAQKQAAAAHATPTAPPVIAPPATETVVVTPTVDNELATWLAAFLLAGNPLDHKGCQKLGKDKVNAVSAHYGLTTSGNYMVRCKTLANHMASAMATGVTPKTTQAPSVPKVKATERDVVAADAEAIRKAGKRSTALEALAPTVAEIAAYLAKAHGVSLKEIRECLELAGLTVS